MTYQKSEKPEVKVTNFLNLEFKRKHLYRERDPGE
jgi:hypothetical protein